MINSIFKKDYSYYYDLIYRDKRYTEETEYIKKILFKYGITKGDLLEFGSGTGKHGRLLAANGYNVHGIEQSKEMLTQAKIIKNFNCQQGDITSIKMGRTYDVVLSLFHVFSYQATNSQAQAVFTNASTHLDVGGLFLLDFWYSPAVYENPPTTRIKRIIDEHIEITRISEPEVYPNENKVIVNYTIFVKDLGSNLIQNFKETHPMRHFSLFELDLLAEAHGFERLQTEEFLTGKIPSNNTFTVCVVLKKKSARGSCI